MCIRDSIRDKICVKGKGKHIFFGHCWKPNLTYRVKGLNEWELIVSIPRRIKGINFVPVSIQLNDEHLISIWVISFLHSSNPGPFDVNSSEKSVLYYIRK